MQLICDGVQRKHDVLQFTVDQYKEVFLKARREFGTVIDVSRCVMIDAVRLMMTVCDQLSAWRWRGSGGTSSGGEHQKGSRWSGARCQGR